MDCIWKTGTREEGEKCADNFMKDIVSKGFPFAYEMSKKIKIE
jgi:hypothetical protein